MVWQRRTDHLFIGGTWVPASGELVDTVSPTTEEVIARVRLGSTADVDAAVDAARRAFDEGPWPRMSLDERIAVIAEFRRLVASEQEVIADLITEELGCPVTQSRNLQAPGPLHIIDSYLETARDFPFREVRSSSAHRALVTREPVGVVAAIAPWNAPVGIPTQKIVPALLAGCTVILKPAPQTALSGLLLADLLDRAGFPPGAVNVVPAEREASERLVTHPGVDKVTFTGSTGAGRRIAALCGQDLKRVSLELGGKSAAIVLDDADLERTVESLRMGSFRNSGQICSLKTRVLVSKRQEDELVERIGGMVGSMRVGDPRDAATEIGPMVSAAQRERVESYIASGRDEGAHLVVGGELHAGQARGWFVAPTVFSRVLPGMRIAREEIFGPVLSVLTYDDLDEAVSIANDTSYGLSGAVFSADPERGAQVASRLRTGVVEVNGAGIGLIAPFGGFKDSGIGRENGADGLGSYTEARSVGLPPERVDVS